LGPIEDLGPIERLGPVLELGPVEEFGPVVEFKLDLVCRLIKEKRHIHLYIKHKFVKNTNMSI
jgi:hypothetical protein